MFQTRLDALLPAHQPVHGGSAGGEAPTLLQASRGGGRGRVQARGRECGGGRGAGLLGEEGEVGVSSSQRRGWRRVAQDHVWQRGQQAW